MPNSIPKRYYDIQSPVLCGDKKDHLLQPYHASMQAEVAACKVAFPNSLLLVTSKSPKPYKQAVERTAWFFKREMRYDFPQYAATEYDKSPYWDHKTDANLRLSCGLWMNTPTVLPTNGPRSVRRPFASKDPRKNSYGFLTGPGFTLTSAGGVIWKGLGRFCAACSVISLSPSPSLLRCNASWSK